MEGGYFSEPYTDKKYIIRWNSFGLGFNEFIEVVPNTICQYTGITDKSGQKIWENDMIGHIFNRVEFVDGAYCVNGDRPLCFMTKECKVIGNIFDNPELLEVE